MRVNSTLHSISAIAYVSFRSKEIFASFLFLVVPRGKNKEVKRDTYSRCNAKQSKLVCRLFLLRGKDWITREVVHDVYGLSGYGQCFNGWRMKRSALYMLKRYTCWKNIHVEKIYMMKRYTYWRNIHVEKIYMLKKYTCTAKRREALIARKSFLVRQWRHHKAKTTKPPNHLWRHTSLKHTSHST